MSGDELAKMIPVKPPTVKRKKKERKKRKGKKSFYARSTKNIRKSMQKAFHKL